MGIEDIQISEELETNAPSIKYSGSEGPKSPQEEKLMKIIEVLMSQGMGQEEAMQVAQQMMAADAEEKQMAGGQPLPNDPTEPVNPFGPKPIGPPLPNRQMAAYGGIMGLDGRKKYGWGSIYQKYIKDPIEMAITGKGTIELENESQRRVDGEQGIVRLGSTEAGKYPVGFDPTKDKLEDIARTVEGTGPVESEIDTYLKGEPGTDAQGNETRTGGAQEYIIPAIGGALAGLFTKGTDPDNPGVPDDTTALQLDDLKKTVNVLDQKQAMAEGFNFTPTVASRKYSPDEMVQVYQNAANGGRIGFNMGNIVPPQMSMMGMNNNIMNRINRAEGGIMDLGGMEKDYRAEGGFVPIGRKEKADDVPARLSVNEFVFTADAVRSAGGGDIDQGAQIMENMMKHLEQGGQVSEESQGMQGARDMFATSQRLGEVL